jgi:hypothetical protein
VSRFGLLSMLAGTLVLLAGLDPGANAGVVLIPMALIGQGIGALASRLGANAVPALPDSMSAEIGGFQNTFTNFGASFGTALVGAVLIGSLTTTFLTGVSHDQAIPASVTAEASVILEAGIPFISDADPKKKLSAPSLDAAARNAIVAENANARLVGLRTSLSVVPLIIVPALFFPRMLPDAAITADNPDPTNPGDSSHAPPTVV